VKGCQSRPGSRLICGRGKLKVFTYPFSVHGIVPLKGPLCLSHPSRGAHTQAWTPANSPDTTPFASLTSEQIPPSLPPRDKALVVTDLP
ncbi:hypothetical protein DBR06_SOUSAS35210004, partial [Sousa chinensis]